LRLTPDASLGMIEAEVIVSENRMAEGQFYKCAEGKCETDCGYSSGAPAV
jgi:hypothetical protein